MRFLQIQKQLHLCTFFSNQIESNGIRFKKIKKFKKNDWDTKIAEDTNCTAWQDKCWQVQPAKSYR